MTTQIGTYKGHPTITLGVETKHPFSFGLTKAKQIVDNIDSIRSFVAIAESGKTSALAPVEGGEA